MISMSGPASTLTFSRRLLQAGLGALALLALLAVLSCRGGGGSGHAIPAAPPAPAAARLPAISGISPAEGRQGTEITVTGSHFTGATRVSFHGAALTAAQYTIDSDTRLRLRVPDGAAPGPGVVTIATAAGSVDSGTFTVLASRSSYYQVPFAPVPVPGGQPEDRMLDFPEVRRTQQYEVLRFPKAPIFHAYNPGYNLPGSRLLAAQFTLNFHLPAEFYPALPESVKALLQHEGIAPAAVDILVVSQDYAYDGVTPQDGVYLFRPQYWTDPGAPNTGTYNQSRTVRVGLREQDPAIHFTGHAPGAFFDHGISVHPAAGDHIVSSGNSLQMSGFDVNHSTAFWSVTRLGDRAAATLHLFFNDNDQTALTLIARTASNLEELVAALNDSPVLQGTRNVRMFKSLTRPIITGCSRATSDSGIETLTLTGDGLAGATRVTLDSAPGSPGPRHYSLSGNTVTRRATDTSLKMDLVVPGGTGDLVVTTPMGESLPFHMD